MCAVPEIIKERVGIYRSAADAARYFKYGLSLEHSPRQGRRLRLHVQLRKEMPISLLRDPNLGKTIEAYEGIVGM